MDAIDNPELMDYMRSELQGMYSVMKEQDANIRLGFLTGVSKIRKLSVFSGLNNLMDILLFEQYNDICGISESELHRYFDEEIQAFAALIIVKCGERGRDCSLGTLDSGKELFYQGIYDIRLVRVGVMACPFNPVQRNSGIPVPRLIVPYAGTGTIPCAAYQQSGAFDFVWQIPFHGLRQHAEAMSGNPGVAFLISLINRHHFPHQLPAVDRSGDSVRA